MQCPIGDGELIAHTTHGENDLTVSYSTCSSCRGHWMESFAANFIKLTAEELQSKGAKPYNPASTQLKCPICQHLLERATGENIPDNVWAFKCPDAHGYFFPAGQLAAFKQAQQTKIAYHKLWNLPLPSVASVLLAGFLMLTLTGGLLAGLVALQNRQTTTSQAKELLTSAHAYVIPQAHQVLITAQTQQNAELTVHLPAFNDFTSRMDSADGKMHTLVIKNIPAGSYSYFFTMQTQGGSIRSNIFTFVIP